jgi:2-methylaconitate cis-trans-isomerase PrpF
MAPSCPGPCNEAASPADDQIVVRIGHPAGIIDVEAECEKTPDGITARRVTYARTARRIMDGCVYVPNKCFE